MTLGNMRELGTAKNQECCVSTLSQVPESRHACCAVHHGDPENGPCSGRFATTAPAGSSRLSTLTWFTGWCGGYSGQLGCEVGAHALRATAATNALDHHANIVTTRIYDHRKTRPEDSPTFKVSY